MNKNPERKTYFRILKSGFLKRIFPDLIGIWSKDEILWKDIYNEIFKRKK